MSAAKINGSWLKIAEIHAHHDGKVKAAQTIYAKENGVWFEVDLEAEATAPAFKTWILYADNPYFEFEPDPDAQVPDEVGLSDVPDGKQYIGFKYNQTETQPSLASFYELSGWVWALRQGGFTWKAFADDDVGTGISLDPTGKDYVGIAVGQMTDVVDISDPSIFIWALREDNDIYENPVSEIEHDITIIQGDIEQLLENAIWDTALHHETTTDKAFLTADVKETADALTTETNARAQQGTQLEAAVEQESGRLDASITRLDTVEADTAGNAQSIAIVQGQVNDPTNGLSAAYSLAQSAKSTSDGNSDSITLLTNKVDHPSTGLSATATIAQNAKTKADGAASSASIVSNEVNDPSTGLSATNLLAQAAKTSADGNASAMTALRADVDSIIGSGSATTAELQLAVTANANDVEQLQAQAYLYTDVNGNIAGMKASSTATSSMLSFKGSLVRFLNQDGSVAIGLNTETGVFEFNGSGTFTGDLAGASGTFTGEIRATFDGRTAAEFENTGTGGWAALVRHTGMGGTALQVENVNLGNAIVSHSSYRALWAVSSDSDGEAVYASNTGNGAGLRANGFSRGVVATSFGYSGGNWGTPGYGVHSTGSNVDFYAAGSGVNYAPFTGSHEGLLPRSYRSIAVGDIVCDKKVVNIKNVSNAICEMGVSQEGNEKSARGVFVARRPLDTQSVASFEDDYDTTQYAYIYDLIIFNSVGEGAMNVCGEGGDIDVGDLITTSNLEGKGMKQGDDVVRNITVAESRQKVVFESPHEVKQIAVIYRCG